MLNENQIELINTFVKYIGKNKKDGKIKLIKMHQIIDWNKFEEGNFKGLKEIEPETLIEYLMDLDLTELEFEDKVLVTWMGVTSGSLGGRDDGYPERKLSVIKADEAFKSKSALKRSSEEYFRLVRIPLEEVIEKVKLEKINLENEEKKKRAQELEKIIEEAKAELENLS